MNTMLVINLTKFKFLPISLLVFLHYGKQILDDMVTLQTNVLVSLYATGLFVKFRRFYLMLDS